MTRHYYTTEMAYRRPEPGHVLCFQHGLVTLQARETMGAPNSFLVRYGKEVTPGLSYQDACAELGAALMHQVACTGALDKVAS